jgi:hypothetical protein
MGEAHTPVDGLTIITRADHTSPGDHSQVTPEKETISTAPAELGRARSGAIRAYSRGSLRDPASLLFLIHGACGLLF